MVEIKYNLLDIILTPTSNTVGIQTFLVLTNNGIQSISYYTGKVNDGYRYLDKTIYKLDGHKKWLQVEN
jgi:hypothetical protein